MSAQAFLSAVQEAQQTGTLEVLLTTSTAPAELVILSSISAFSGSLVNLLVYLFAGVAVFRASIHANLFSCAAVLILSLAIALALGIAAATLQVAFQKGSALLWLLGSGTLVSEWNHVPDSQLAAPARTSVARRSSDVRHRRNAAGAAGGADRSMAMAPTLAVLAGFGVVLAAAGAGWPVAQFAARAAEWNPLILLSMLIRALELRPVALAPGKAL